MNFISIYVRFNYNCICSLLLCFILYYEHVIINVKLFFISLILGLFTEIFIYTRIYIFICIISKFKIIIRFWRNLGECFILGFVSSSIYQVLFSTYIGEFEWSFFNWLWETYFALFTVLNYGRKANALKG